jgi:hypothetical protein
VLHNDDTSMPGPGCSSPARGWTPGRVVFPTGRTSTLYYPASTRRSQRVWLSLRHTGRRPYC